MLLQTLVEIAVKHGIGRSLEGGLIVIPLRLDSETLELHVRHTGRCDPDPGDRGFGLRIVAERHPSSSGGCMAATVSPFTSDPRPQKAFA
jgi:LytS/YehU family sensor histidine kinase